MNSIEKKIRENAIEIPMGADDRSLANLSATGAGRFADRVHRNILAVLAVARYLNWQGMETDLEAGDSWHPALRMISDVADLHVKNVGRLECRVIAPDATTIEIPLEVSEDRVAYMVLELSEQPLGGKLLGLFVPGAEPVYSIALSDLKDMDESIEYLSELESATVPVISAIASTESTIAAAIKERVIEVGRWFNGGLDRVSESLNAVLLGTSLNFSTVQGENSQELNLYNLVERINKLQRSRNIQIPKSASQVRYSLEDKYCLYIFVWKLLNSSNEWAILTAVVASGSVDELPVGLAIDIYDENQLLEKSIAQSRRQDFVYACAIGESYMEKLTITLVLPDERIIFSEQFIFDSNIQ